MPQPLEDPVGRRDNRRADRDSERVGGEVGEAEIPVGDEVLDDLDARAVEEQGCDHLRKCHAALVGTPHDDGQVAEGDEVLDRIGGRVRGHGGTRGQRHPCDHAECPPEGGSGDSSGDEGDREI